ncbi:UPF0058 family protein [Halobaculum marinum]|uniref:UPF0058 family protein n=1 Tax=Halobaculum marinum TaxID=3031996 RepID=A0ABD5WST4_9EURY|nr:UPF0058 family protein [Halobaculum sp. DT55]
MRKHELVHLHALVRTVADHLIDRDALDADALADYETRGVTPMSLQASRDDHKRALLTLAAAVADDLATEVTADFTTDAVSATVADATPLAEATNREQAPDDDHAARPDGPAR